MDCGWLTWVEQLGATLAIVFVVGLILILSFDKKGDGKGMR